MNTKLTTVTPAMAAEMLKRNTGNRKIRMAHVNRLKAEILGGRWLVTHQGIAFAEDDSLLDGQHRLMAIEAAGKSVQILVTTGVQKHHNGDLNINAMDVIDCGKSRSTTDQLHLLHGVTNTNIVVGALNMIGSQLMGGSRFVPSLSVGQAVKLLDIYGNSIELFIPMAGRSKLWRKSAIIGALAVAHRIAPNSSEHFMKQLCSGSGIGAGDPVYALRESLIAFPMGSTQVDRVNLFLRVTQALYNTIQEVPVKSAKVSKAGLQYFMAQDAKIVEAVKKIILGE